MPCLVSAQLSTAFRSHVSVRGTIEVRTGTGQARLPRDRISCERLQGHFGSAGGRFVHGLQDGNAHQGLLRGYDIRGFVPGQVSD